MKQGIYLPDSGNKRESEGTVVAVGPGARDADGKLVAPSLKEGDKVLLPEFGGTKVMLEEDE